MDNNNAEFRGVEDLVESAMIFAYTDLIRDLWQLQGNVEGKSKFDQHMKDVLVKTHEMSNINMKYIGELLGMMDYNNVKEMKKNILAMTSLRYPDFITKIIDIEAMDKILPQLPPEREEQLKKLAERMTEDLMRKTGFTDEEDGR